MGHSADVSSRRVRLRCLAASALWPMWSARSVLAATPFKMGIVPYFSPSRLEQIYVPAAAQLANEIDHPVVFRTSSSFDKYFAQLKAQAYDIALVHSLFYVPAVDEFGYLPLARLKEPFSAVVVVPEDSRVRSVEDLRDQVIATPPTYLPAVHLAKKALRDRGLVRAKNVRFTETRSVDACLQQALAGEAQACVAPPFMAKAFQAATGVRLRVVLTSAELPSLVFVAHRRIPEEVRHRVRAALLAWNDTDAGRAVLKNINTAALVPAADEDFDGVRAFVRSLDEPWLPSDPSSSASR